MGLGRGAEGVYADGRKRCVREHAVVSFVITVLCALSQAESWWPSVIFSARVDVCDWMVSFVCCHS